jgi:hypothetical protein
MLAAGLLGGPGIGFLQDQNASENLRQASPAVFERYKSPKENEFLWLKTAGLDGVKVGVLEDGGKEAQRALDLMRSDKNTNPKALTEQESLVKWWDTSAAATAARAESADIAIAAGVAVRAAYRDAIHQVVLLGLHLRTTTCRHQHELRELVVLVQPKGLPDGFLELLEPLASPKRDRGLAARGLDARGCALCPDNMDGTWGAC